MQDIEDLTTNDYGLIRKSNETNTPGEVSCMIIGEEEGYVRWVNLPAVDTNVQLVVERLPLIPITRDRQLFTGVREEHHYHLLKWVRHLAYRKQDADSFNLVKSDQERNDFSNTATWPSVRRVSASTRFARHRMEVSNGLFRMRGVTANS